ncbi:hypothetical protein [Phytohabitans kaempferiae]|uniref:Uncharacterized protein n=1 Tax=Phytohabitans kaempferiae TaxID=1620943 RepID=A0ABV6MGH9_9ACTN
MTTIRVASGKPLVTGMAMAKNIVVPACGQGGTTEISNEIAKQMGV